MATKPLPSPEVLRQLLRYEPDTGNLFWIERGAQWFKDSSRHTAETLACAWNKRHAGKRAFTPINSSGYHTGTVFRVMLQSHRICWAIHYGMWPEKFIDHINGVRTDNRLCNLREATHAENSRNSGIPRGESGVRGVRMDKRWRKKWQARITVAGVAKSLGYYETKEEAIAARLAAAKKYHGDFARMP